MKPKFHFIPIEFVPGEFQTFPVKIRVSRTEAIAKGDQIEVSAIAQQAGFGIPVFFTRKVFDTCIVRPEGVKAQARSSGFWTS
jgi:hypothetical protein